VETPADPRQSDCEPPEGGYPAVEAYVFYPETYRGCAPFRIAGVSRTFRTSVGPGPTACHRTRREFVAYGIAYESVELGTEGVEGGADRGPAEGLSTFVAVPTPAEDDPPLPHDYFVPAQSFQFVAAGEELVLHARCSEPATPVQAATFAAVE
jgi:hypothetical protein